MPQQQTFQITAPDGKTTLEITGDRVPTAAELQEIFKASGITVPSAPSTQLETPLSHPHAKVGQAVIDAAKGIKAGALSTVYHGGDVIRRSLGMERVIDTPEAQAVITPPDNLAGKAGFLVEQGAEFAVPLTRLAKLTKSMGLGKRMAVDAAASLGVAAVPIVAGSPPLCTAPTPRLEAASMAMRFPKPMLFVSLASRVNGTANSAPCSTSDPILPARLSGGVMTACTSGVSMMRSMPTPRRIRSPP